MTEKTGVKGNVQYYNPTDTSNILDIHRFLTKETYVWNYFKNVDCIIN